MLSLIALLAACVPTAHIQVLEPADVYLPQHLQTVAVIDRSRGSSSAEQAGRREALSELEQVLQSSPRFEVIPVPDGQARGLASGGFSWSDARALCEHYGCDGVVALESFDASIGYDTVISTERDEEEEREVKGYEVSLTVEVRADWQLYDMQEQRIADELWSWRHTRSWEKTGDSEEEAQEELPSRREAVCLLARSSGEDYGRRIAPSYVTVRRPLYGRGAGALKAARPAISGEDWEAAEALWQEAALDPAPKVSSRALYNQAVLQEVRGDLTAALALAREAEATRSRSRTRAYIATLQRRLVDQARVEEQLNGDTLPAPEGTVSDRRQATDIF
jgi:hypothetical protein